MYFVSKTMPQGRKEIQTKKKMNLSQKQGKRIKEKKICLPGNNEEKFS